MLPAQRHVASGSCALVQWRGSVRRMDVDVRIDNVLGNGCSCQVDDVFGDCHELEASFGLVDTDIFENQNGIGRAGDRSGVAQQPFNEKPMITWIIF